VWLIRGSKKIYPFTGSKVQGSRVDVPVKSGHSREACPRPDRGAGVHKWLIPLDSRVRGNDENGLVTFYMGIILTRSKIAAEDERVNEKTLTLNL